MGDLVNLNRARKSRARTEKAKRADENARKYGRSKAEKTQETRTADKARRDLDGHKLTE